MKILIGLVGEKSSGKDTVTKLIECLLPQKKIVQIRFSDILTETLDIWGLPKSRKNYQKLSPVFRKLYGRHVLSNAVMTRAEATNADIVILNGIRWREDVTMLRSFKEGVRNILVYVTAPVNLRYSRSVVRGEKIGEKNTTFKQFMKEEKAYTEILIPKIGKKADIIVQNTGSMKDLRDFVASKLIPIITNEHKKN